MTGVIDAGGGLRGIYGAGVFDRCMDDGLQFDKNIGVSAGSANVASFLAGQRGRNYRFYAQYSLRKEYMGAGCLLSCGSFLDLRYVYATLSDEGGEDPLDYPAFSRSSGDYTAVATDSRTGKAVYFTKKDLRQNDYRVLIASCSIPAVCRPAKLGGGVFHDGGIADPVPIDYALRCGCDKTVVILTRPVDFVLETGLDYLAARLLRLRYPRVSEGLRRRREVYASAVQKAVELQRQGKCLIIAPDDCCGLETLTREPEKLDAFYRKGYRDAAKIKSFLLS